MEVKEFWRQYEVADKEHKRWEKRADKVLQRYRLETEAGDPTTEPAFNILWANTAVLLPSYFSQVPTPDITRRYKDDDPIGAQGSKVIERSLEFVLDDGDFYEFGEASVLDYLLPGRTVCKVRYVPTYARVRQAVPVEAREQLGPDGVPVGFQYFHDDEELDPAEVKFNEGVAFIEVEVEEVVDEHVDIDRWPWKNFRHQKVKRWKDCGWVDYISYLDSDQLKRLLGRKAKGVELTVDGTGNEDGKDDGFQATHAEVHEVWFARDRKVRVAVKGNLKNWLKEIADPLRLDKFYPTPPPLLAIDTNDSLQPIPLFTFYQHQANELDLITKRIAKLMRALKLAGLYAGSEKDTLKKLFESDENEMIAVEDWNAIKSAGGINGLVDWLPIEQVGKVLTALFREREQIISQIFELTGIADIERGSTDPRETKGSQVIKAQFSSRRQQNPKQEVERYFRDVLRIAAEVMAEHFSTDTLQRMTGLQIPPEVRQLLQDELQRQYRIDIETDSTVAPDQEREQANMAKALEAVTNYVATLAPMVQQGTLDQRAAIQLLKVYLRKFKWGREMEEMLEQIERAPPEERPDPEKQRMEFEAKLEQQKVQSQLQIEAQKAQMDLQKQQSEMQLRMQEMQANLREIQMRMELDARKSQQEMSQDAQRHSQEMIQDQQVHEQELIQARQLADAKALQVRRGNENRPST